MMRLEATTSELLRELLLCCLEEAQTYSKSDSPMGTLARVVEACDAIETGEAVHLAAEAKLDSKSFGGARPRINLQSVDLYIRVREKRDRILGRQSEWTGPRAETIHRSEHLKAYVHARRDALQLRPKPTLGSRGRRLEEIVGRIKPPEDQQDIRFALAEGERARREVLRLKRIIEDELPELNPNALLTPDGSTMLHKKAVPEPADASILKRLLDQLTSSDHLQWFGLTFDGDALK